MLKIGLYGTVLILICNFTPLLVSLMVGLDFAHLVVRVDGILFPLLAGFILLTGIGYAHHPCRPETPE